MIKKFTQMIQSKTELSFEQAEELMNALMQGQFEDQEIADFLVALNDKGFAVNEVAGFVAAMRANMIRLDLDSTEAMIDTCGTGGDASGTFNISTAVALVTAGAGVVVAKHGNRAISSRSGSADVLKQLGVNIEMAVDDIQKCLKEVGIAFLFAPLFHPAMKHAAGARKLLGVRTIFNVLGPLCNPASVKRQVIGVFDVNLLVLLANVLQKLGAEHVLLVHGHDGLDEISLTAPTSVVELKPDGAISTYEVTPQSLGLHECVMEDLKGDDALCNAKIITQVLSGEDHGPCRDIVVANAGAAIYVSGVVSSMKEGVKKAQFSIDSGAALKKLMELAAKS